MLVVTFRVREISSRTGMCLFCLLPSWRMRPDSPIVVFSGAAFAAVMMSAVAARSVQSRFRYADAKAAIGRAR